MEINKVTRDAAILLLNAQILKDYEEFKKKNELIFCSCKQVEVSDDHIGVMWSTTRKYQTFDTDKITEDFHAFMAENLGDQCSITKVTNQEHAHIVEFSLMRDYELGPKFEIIEKGEE